MLFQKGAEVRHLFMVMDYEGGGTLQDLVDRNRDALRESYIRELLSQLVDGVSTSIACKFRASPSAIVDTSPCPEKDGTWRVLLYRRGRERCMLVFLLLQEEMMCTRVLDA